MGKKLTTEEFISRAKKVHGNKYDYSLVDYVKYNIPVKIICKIHGIFEQKPGNHNRGCGCQWCGRRITREDFIERAQKIHKDLYDYSLVKIGKSNNDVSIICKNHGVFKQYIWNHLKGKGCNQCSGNKKKTTKSFIKEAKEIHGDLYDYHLVEYVNSNTEVTIVCKKHGEIKQKPQLHIVGYGCRFCGYERLSEYRKKNFSGSFFSISDYGNYFKEASLYVLRLHSRGERFYKIGVTSLSVFERFSHSMPYSFDIVRLFKMTGKDARGTEIELHKTHKPAQVFPKKSFNGYTECFKKVDLELIDKLCEPKLLYPIRGV